MANANHFGTNAYTEKYALKIRQKYEVSCVAEEPKDAHFGRKSNISYEALQIYDDSARQKVRAMTR